MPESYLDFVPTGRSKSGRTAIWTITNKETRATLGTIQWYAPWRRYVFHSRIGRLTTVFEERCLRDIATFIEGATRVHKDKTGPRCAQGCGYPVPTVGAICGECACEDDCTP